jgi:hypothetical protein
VSSECHSGADIYSQKQGNADFREIQGPTGEKSQRRDRRAIRYLRAIPDVDLLLIIQFLIHSVSEFDFA